MKNYQEKLDQLFVRYTNLDCVKEQAHKALNILIELYENKGKLLVCGNGGSSADALHFVAELMKNFSVDRKISGEVKEKLLALGKDGEFLANHLQGALPAIALTCSIAFETAFANDSADGFTFSMAQEVLNYGNSGDALFAISTSGKSKNVIYACKVAKALGLKVIALTGANGGELKELADCIIEVPETETFKIQELHLPIYHALSLALEEYFF